VALSEDGEIVRILDAGKGHDETLGDVCTFVKGLRRDGQTKEAILARLEALLGSVSDEQEDVLLEVMDFLVGWCSPHMRID
jgi:hypothetical protein